MDLSDLDLVGRVLILDFVLNDLQITLNTVKLSEHCIINRSLKVLILSEKLMMVDSFYAISWP